MVAKNPSVGEMMDALSKLPRDAEMLISADYGYDAQIHVFPQGEPRGVSGLLWDSFDGFVERG